MFTHSNHGGQSSTASTKLTTVITSKVTCTSAAISYLFSMGLNVNPFLLSLTNTLPYCFDNLLYVCPHVLYTFVYLYYRILCPV